MSEYTILFLGDVVGKPGRNAVKENLPGLIREHNALFTIINGENSAGGLGITPAIAEEFYAAGADAITLGNHAYNKREIEPYLNSGKPIVRPYNISPNAAGKGIIQIQKDGIQLAIMNMCGPANSVLGMNRDIILRRFRTGLPEKFEVANEPGGISAVKICVEKKNGKAKSIDRIRV